jgi:hypothetical protein
LRRLVVEDLLEVVRTIQTAEEIHQVVEVVEEEGQGAINMPSNIIPHLEGHEDVAEDVVDINYILMRRFLGCCIRKDRTCDPSCSCHRYTQDSFSKRKKKYYGRS